MAPNIYFPSTTAYAASHGSDIYFAVKDRLYRFNKNAQTVDWGVDLNSGMSANQLLLTPDVLDNYLFNSNIRRVSLINGQRELVNIGQIENYNASY